MNTGKCPKCDAILTSVVIEGISAKQLTGNSWNAVSYLCPYCRAILGVAIDPIAVKSDIVNEVVKSLRGR